VEACVKKYTPAGLMIYSNSHVPRYGRLGNIMWYIDNLKWILKNAQDKCECYGWPSRRETGEDP
jgi:hypothetical protein